MMQDPMRNDHAIQTFSIGINNLHSPITKDGWFRGAT